jgi:hypothetical protein
MNGFLRPSPLLGRYSGENRSMVAPGAKDALLINSRGKKNQYDLAKLKSLSDKRFASTHRL